MKKVIIIVVSALLFFGVGYAILGGEPKLPPRDSDDDEMQVETVRRQASNRPIRRIVASRFDDEELDERDEIIANLEERMQQLEKKVGGNNGTEENDELNREGTADKNDMRMSEKDFAGWMGSVINDKEWDNQRTEEVTRQIKATMATSMPNVNVEDVGCGSRFCQATLTGNEAQSVSVRNLIGAPPFTSETFTIQKADGSVEVYFTKDGVSLAQLKEEASGTSDLGRERAGAADLDKAALESLEAGR